jgi:hypothetical protein
MCCSVQRGSSATTCWCCQSTGRGR